MNICIHLTDSFCCIAETTTTIYINCTSIKINQKDKKTVQGEKTLSVNTASDHPIMFLKTYCSTGQNGLNKSRLICTQNRSWSVGIDIRLW